jgi:hypothetical protein
MPGLAVCADGPDWLKITTARPGPGHPDCHRTGDPGRPRRHPYQRVRALLRADRCPSCGRALTLVGGDMSLPRSPTSSSRGASTRCTVAGSTACRRPAATLTTARARPTTRSRGCVMTAGAWCIAAPTATRRWRSRPGTGSCTPRWKCPHPHPRAARDLAGGTPARGAEADSALEQAAFKCTYAAGPGHTDQPDAVVGHAGLHGRPGGNAVDRTQPGDHAIRPAQTVAPPS